MIINKCNLETAAPVSCNFKWMERSSLCYFGIDSSGLL